VPKFHRVYKVPKVEENEKGKMVGRADLSVL
jgi:hypothetical protein